MEVSVFGVLSEAIRRLGDRALADPDLLKSWFQEMAPHLKREANALALAIEAGVVTELRNHPLATFAQRRSGLIERLLDQTALSPEFAEWAVDAWAQTVNWMGSLSTVRPDDSDNAAEPESAEGDLFDHSTLLPEHKATPAKQSVPATKPPPARYVEEPPPPAPPEPVVEPKPIAPPPPAPNPQPLRWTRTAVEDETPVQPQPEPNQTRVLGVPVPLWGLRLTQTLSLGLILILMGWCVYWVGFGGKEVDFSPEHFKAGGRFLLAALGSTRNQFGHALALQRGDQTLPRDVARARVWLERAAENGHLEAMFAAGQLALSGEGGERDPAEGLRWFRKAAENDHAGAMFRLGEMYETGVGVEKDEAGAAAWYMKAVDRDVTVARTRLARMYRAGRGVPRNLVEAERLYREACEANEKFAMLELAEMIEKNLIKPSSPNEAALLRQKAQE